MKNNILTSLLIILAISLHWQCVIPKKQVSEPINKVDSTKAKIKFQKRLEYSFNSGEIKINNQFDGARFNAVSQQNDSTFTLTILPENSPINSSPWFAFKVWSKNSSNLYFNLKYPTTVHRYSPKQSADGLLWSTIKDVKLNSDSSEAFFKIQTEADTLFISAQELINAKTSYKWIDSLGGLTFLRKEIIGKSILNNPITALSSKTINGKKIIVVLSRQHPPEVTGYMAMQSFVNTITASTNLANRFRKHFQLVIIPFINPDGVTEGNWRHNAAGVDLNRDWDLFKQPEIAAVKDFLLNLTTENKAKVYFAIDFHSTYQDIFYINEDHPQQKTNLPGFTKEWLKAMETSIPGFKPKIRPSSNGGNVSKSWMGRVLKAEALTYEVGDSTPRPMLKLKGQVAAEQMMKLLLERNLN